MLRPCRPPFRGLCALGLALTLGLGAARAGAEPPARGARKLQRYPPSFRLAVKEAIAAGLDRLGRLQAPEGHWGDPQHEQVMGHTALPLLALLKGGRGPQDDHVQRAFRALRRMKMQRVYSVALYLMALQARYQPALDVLDTDVGTQRGKRVKPKQVRKRLSAVDRKTIEDGLAYLLRARNASDLWHYDVPPGPAVTGHDLSNTQYGLLGLRAAMDCGFKVKSDVWQSALRALLQHQDVKGPEVSLRTYRIKEGYVFDSKEPAEARPFHYTTRRQNGPQGENTVWVAPATGSMTTAGVACVAICQEGLWRSRRFRGADRKRSRTSIRDGLAWMQEHFTVTENPGHPNKAHHMYYLYGLERMGMLTGRRWLGAHDWYKQGADLLLERQDVVRGGWGNHVQTSFGVLFLKRATRRTETVVLTD